MTKRTLHRLSARAVETAPAGRHADGGGLYLSVDAEGRKRWVMLYQRAGRRVEMGLGGAGQTGVSLANARKVAARAREQLQNDLDPLEMRRAARRAARPALTFGTCATDYIAAHRAEWKNPKHIEQWTSTLETYTAPFWDLPVDRIGTQDILEILKPIWATKAETASRLRGRIEKVLDAARVQGLRQGENPARWRGHLDALLARPSKRERGHHEAMDYAAVGAFLAKLKDQSGIAARALEFAILTAARSGEVRLAPWGEFDLEAATWRVPAVRMKMKREHRVPLSPRAVEILKDMLPHATRQDGSIDPTALVFPSARRNKPLSDMTLTAILRRMNLTATPHGFRASFRTWAGERTSFPAELAEAALAHAAGDATVQAYARGDLFDRRRELMVAWADYLARTAAPAAASNVVELRAS
jgi:integrase